MNWLDWTVLLGTLLFIVSYGVWRTREQKSVLSYLKGDNSLGWGSIGLSVMATQASAITFLSTPGLGYESGLRFIQNYFGLPLALIIVSAVFIPIFYRLKVYTAYEFLENRFDIRIRLFTAFLFLLSRGLAAGITIYAPAIILSTILDWNLNMTIICVGLLVIIYTVSGGSKAVSITQKYQMAVIMIGMFTTFGIMISHFPPGFSFWDGMELAGISGRLEAVDFSFDPTERYTFWSGITGGLFLALSYFGTDQSQVQRYLGGKDVRQSRMGMMFNAALKIPMQFFILLTGVMLFVFYQWVKPPIYFKDHILNKIRQTELAPALEKIEQAQQENFVHKRERTEAYFFQGDGHKDDMINLQKEEKNIRQGVISLIHRYDPKLKTKDSDYVFLTFVINYLPHGIIGLLLAVILSAAMSSTSSELNALASTSMVDFYKRLGKKQRSEKFQVKASKLLTLLWGVLAISFALMAHLVENLIEAVNIIGSLFYGTILGIFLVAFFLKRINGKSVFVGAVTSQVAVLTLHFMSTLGFIDLGYLWYNVIATVMVLGISYYLNKISPT